MFCSLKRQQSTWEDLDSVYIVRQLLMTYLYICLEHCFLQLFTFVGFFFCFFLIISGKAMKTGSNVAI